MRWIKNKYFLLSLVFVAVYLILHIPYLGVNELNPDAVNWHKRSEQFVLGLKSGDLALTYQHYHPGVTLMWIVGVPVEIVKQFTSVGTVYTADTYVLFHTVAKLSLISVNLILALLTIFFLTKVTGFNKALLIVFFLNAEPFFLGNAKVLHMDILFTSLVMLALITGYLMITTEDRKYLILSGLFSALAVLTRSVGVGVVLFNSALLLYTLLVTKTEVRKTLKAYSIYFLSFIIVFVILFPALWVSPIDVLDKMFTRSFEIGVEEGHPQIYFGEETENPGMLFYPITLLMKVSPFILTGVFFYLLFEFVLQLRERTQIKDKVLLLITAKRISFAVVMTVFFLGYFGVYTLSSKKLDRYMLPLFFPLSFFAVYGYSKIVSLKPNLGALYTISFLFLASVFVPILSLYPYEFLYYSPLFKNSKNANSVIGVKNFGIAHPSVADLLITKYSCLNKDANFPANFKVVSYRKYECPKTAGKVNAGIYVSKNLLELYGNQNTKNTRYDGPESYDIYIRSINDNYPKKIKTKGLNFELDSSVYISDVELWRFYVKTSEKQ